MMRAEATGPRICTLLFRRVGDSLLATPTLRALKQQMPEYLLQVITEPQTERVFEYSPWVDEITVTERVKPWQLARLMRAPGKPDIVLDFLSDPRSAIATLMSCGPVRIGFDIRGRRHCYTRTVPVQQADSPVYTALHKLRLAEALGIHQSDTATEFYLSQKDREFAEMVWMDRGWYDRPIAAFFIHSRREYKRWPANHFAEVIRHLKDQDHVLPLILSTPEDESAVETLRTLSGISESQILELRDLGHLGAVLARCKLLVGNDGGPKHIAVALDVPTVTIFRDERPEYWTPPGDNRHQAVAARPGETISSVSPQIVIGAIERVQPDALK